MMFDMPIVCPQMSQRAVSGRLAIASSLVIGLGPAVMVFSKFYH
jgi:hypothetical protein